MSTNDPRPQVHGHHEPLLSGRESALLLTAFFTLALSIVSVFTI